MDIDGPLPPPALLHNDKGKVANTKLAPWAEKYCPRSLADIAAHCDIVDTIDWLMKENRLPLLLYGPPGTGKTSMIEGLMPYVSSRRRIV